jgi:dethiobiotin synthetase
MSEPRKISLFVTGTDTGVGKSLVSAALLHALAKHYPRAVGMKPIAAGTRLLDGQEVNDDVLALRAASTVRVPPQLDNPVLLRQPLSPHLAAAHENTRIDIAHIADCHRQLLLLADAVVVEGAGGFLVPLSATETGADLAHALNLPVILVVGLRLGCLNHALLTAEAIAARGLTLAGWVANQIDPAMAAVAGNMAFLEARLAAPLLTQIPFDACLQPQDVQLELRTAWL